MNRAIDLELEVENLTEENINLKETIATILQIISTSHGEDLINHPKRITKLGMLTTIRQIKETCIGVEKEYESRHRSSETNVPGQTS